MKEYGPAGRKLPWLFAAGFSLFVLAVAAVGFLYFSNEKSQMVQDENAELSIVAHLKVEQITNWLGERRSDGRRIFDNPFLPPMVERWLKTGNASLKEELLRWMKAQMVSDEYENLIILDENGSERLATEEDVMPQGAGIRDLISKANESNNMVLSDLYRDERSGRVLMTMLVPVLLDRRPESKPIAMVILNINPDRFLFPLIQAQPTSSFSSETLLFRHENENVIFLNELRHMRGTALRLQRHVSSIDIPSVRAVLGERGVIEGVDYRGVPVIAVVEEIPDTNWFLETKMDVDEIYRPIKERAVIVIALSLAAIVIFWLGALFFLRRRLARFYRKQYEAEANYRAIFNAANDAIFIHDMLSGDIVDVNQKMCEMYRYTPDEALRLKVEDLSAGESPYTQNDALDRIQAAAGGQPQLFEWMAKDKSGRLFWVEVNLKHATIGGVPRLLAVVRDISERKRVEEKLRADERFLANVFSSIQDGIYVIDNDFTILRVNPTIERWFAHAMPLVGKKCYEAFRGRTHECENCPNRKLLTCGIPGNEVVPKIGADGSVVGWLDLFNYPMIDDATGKVKGIIAYARDITERKRAEEEARKNELLYRSLAESSEDFIFVVGRDDIVQYVNSYGARALGMAPHEVIGNPRSILFKNPENDRQREGLQQVFNSGASAHIIEGTRFLAGEICLDTRLVPLKDENGEVTAVLGLSRDITERKRYEEQLKQYSENLEQLVDARSKELDQARAVLFSSSKLAAMGRMGAGIAHQLNSPLCGSLLMVDDLLEDCRELRGPCDKLQSLRRSLEGMQHVIECMLSLAMISRRGAPTRKRIDINLAIKGILEFTSLELQKSAISAVRQFSDEPLLIEANVGELEQVFLNVINNAVDAMEHGGMLTVVTMKTMEGVEVRISDTGNGIAAENLDKIFEPFFSSKGKKRGLGLGLSIAREIVERYNGRIRVESAVGKGTTFSVILPIDTGNH